MADALALQDPMTPPDCDLQDFGFMPLDVARLRDSGMASDESPDACWAAVLLWAASWHQVPAASIPDNDNWIAKQAGYAQRGKIAREWQEVREGALRGWVLCADGRWYHPVVAEKAREAWKAKLDQRWRSECARIKKHNQRHGTHIACPGFAAWTRAGRPQGQVLPVADELPLHAGDKAGDKGSKRQGEGQREGQGDPVVNSPDLLTGVEAGPPPRPAALIPLVDGTEHGVSAIEVAEWSLAFPAVDVPGELARVRVWSLANRAQRKTRRGVNGFIVAWLSRVQDKGGSRGGGGHPGGPGGLSGAGGPGGQGAAGGPYAGGGMGTSAPDARSFV